MIKSIHFHETVTTKGEKKLICLSGWSEKISEIEHRRVYKNNISCAMLTECLRTFVYYVKARSNVYIFAFATLISFLLGSHGHALNYHIAVRIVFSSYIMALATYIYNDIADLEVDKINKTNRPSVAGKATGKQLRMIVLILNGTALLLSFSVGLSELYISVLFITLGFAYSHPRSNLKDKFPLKTVVTAAGAALLSLLGGAAAFMTATTNSYNDYNDGSFLSAYYLPVGYAALFFFSFFFILGPLGDICDLKGDRTVGRRTFPIVLGIRSTIVCMLTIPLTIILMVALLACYFYHDNPTSVINLSGVYFIVGTCIATLVFILRISKKANANDVSAIKSMRPKMRLLHIMLQISLLLIFV
jgi:geranylgeranylglycerol-phosphate geranylgeranyltransferase